MVDVRVNSLRCDPIVYKGQEFAGRSIVFFPMVRIFEDYTINPSEAYVKFAMWMRAVIQILLSNIAVRSTLKKCKCTG